MRKHTQDSSDSRDGYLVPNSAEMKNIGDRW
jgi:hypothetical protein